MTARPHLTGPCLGCSTPTPSADPLVVRSSNLPAGTARWLCLCCMNGALVDPDHMDRIDAAQAAGAAA